MDWNDTVFTNMCNKFFLSVRNWGVLIILYFYFLVFLYFLFATVFFVDKFQFSSRSEHEFWRTAYQKCNDFRLIKIIQGD
jgi:uncharacterized SAM-binding protein YcdF (DUF218 family)